MKIYSQKEKWNFKEKKIINKRKTEVKLGF